MTATTNRQQDFFGNGTIPSGAARLPGTNIYTEWVLVTPAIALEWLKRKRPNRNKIIALIKAYMRDMIDGVWMVTHEGVAFDANGDLADGQHRLEGIANSGKSQWILTTFNLDEKAIEFIDRGKVRTLAHAMQCLGLPFTHKGIAIARQMYYGPQLTRSGVNDSILRRFAELNREAILFAEHSIKAPAPVGGVVARAYYSADLCRLERFGRALADTIGTDDAQAGDRSARMLTKIIEASSNGGAASISLYLKAQNVLRAYLDHRDLQKVYETKEDLFPLADDRFPKDVGEASREAEIFVELH